MPNTVTVLCPRLETELDVIRLPRAFFLIFAEAHRVLARPTEGRTIGIARITAADRDENQAHRAADRRIGAKAWTEHAGVAIDIKLLSERPIQQQSRTDIAGGRLNAVKIEPRLADRFDRGDDDRQDIPASSRP